MLYLLYQTRHTGVPFSSPSVTVSGKSQFQNTPAVISRVKPEEMHPYQSLTYLSSSNQTESAQGLVASHFSTPISSQSHNGTVICPINGISLSTSSMSHPSVLVPRTLQNQVQPYESQTSATDVLVSTPEGINPVPSSVASSTVHPTLSSSQAPMQLFNSPVISSSYADLPLSAHSPLIPFYNVAMPPMININSQTVPDHSMTYPAASFGRPTSGPLLTPPPSNSAPNQLAQSGYTVLSQMQKLNPNSDMDYGIPAQAGVFSSISSQTPREMLLPLPTSALQVLLLFSSAKTFVINQ